MNKNELLMTCPFLEIANAFTAEELKDMMKMIQDGKLTGSLRIADMPDYRSEPTHVVLRASKHTPKLPRKPKKKFKKSMEKPYGLFKNSYTSWKHENTTIIVVVKLYPAWVGLADVREDLSAELVSTADGKITEINLILRAGMNPTIYTK